MTVQSTEDFSTATPVLAWHEYYAPDRKSVPQEAVIDAPAASAELVQMYEYYAA